MRVVYISALIAAVWVIYDFTTRVWTPLNEQSPEVKEYEDVLGAAGTDSATLPDSLVEWFKDEPQKQKPAEKPKGPTAEEIAAREQAERRNRMEAHGVAIGDYVFVLRGASIGQVSIAVLEVLAPDDDKITTELVKLNSNYKGFTLEQVEPLKVVISYKEERITVPLFKS